MSDLKAIWVNNMKTPASYEKEYQNTSAKITRLVEDPEIKKRIEFDEISLQEDQHTTNLDRGSYPVYTVLGSDYPIIRINDAFIAKADIKSMTISSIGFVPTISLDLDLKTTEFVNRHIPKDGDMISTYVQVNTSALNYLRNDFIVTSCSSSIKNSQHHKVHLEGKMFIPRFDTIQGCFGVIGTAKDVFKEVAKTYGLGFAYNDEDDTNDYMNWICCKQTIPNFLQEVISHTWKDGKDFYKTWVDLYYNICFVNMNKFLLSTESTEEDLDYTFKTTVMNYFETQLDDVKNETKKVIKIFSNEGSFRDSPFFITSWRPINNSNIISFNYGYESDSFAFIHNQGIYENDPEDCFNVSQNIPNYDETKLDDHIIFRGRGRWEEGSQPDDDLRRVNYDFVNNYIDSTWCGVEYVMSEEDARHDDNTQWSGNVHPNYPHAPYHNMINNKELDKMYIEVEVAGLCLQVMRGEKIPVYLIYPTLLDSAINRSEKNEDVYSKTNKFYSGFYIVDSIEYRYKDIKGEFSNFTTRMVLKRREWPTPEPVQGEELYDETGAEF